MGDHARVRSVVSIAAAVVAALAVSRDARAQVQTVWLEAESVRGRGAGPITSPLLIKDDDAASNAGYIEVEPGNDSKAAMPSAEGVASYSFTVDRPGVFRIWARVIAPSDDADSFWVRMDGGAPIRWNQIPQGRSWHWTLVKAEGASRFATFDLAAGTHTLSSAYREDGARLDVLVITTDMSFDLADPPVMPPATPTINSSWDDYTLHDIIVSWTLVPGARSYTVYSDGVAVASGITGHKYTDSVGGCYSVVADNGVEQSPPQPYCEPRAPYGLMERQTNLRMSAAPPMVMTEYDFYAPRSVAESLAAPPRHGRARLDFRLAGATSIRIWAIVDAPDRDHDSFWVRMDSGRWIKWNNLGDPHGCEDLRDSDRGGAPVIFTLGPGSHRLELAYREVGARLSYMAFTEFLDYEVPCDD